jgi:hypothetical protein
VWSTTHPVWMRRLIHRRSEQTTTKKGRDNDQEMSAKMKALATGAAITCVLGGGAAAVLLPGVAVASQRADT